MRRVLLLALAFLFAGSVGTFANPAYDPKPWLEDLAQMRAALSAKYADLEWAVFVREIDMSALFADTRKRIETGGSDADARAAFDRLIRRLGDGHVELHWPRNGAAMTPNAAPDACAHYDAARAARPLAAYAPGYVSLETPQSDVFAIGTIASGKRRVGVIKIAAFDPYSTPQLCRAALAALAIPADRLCDDACSDRIDDWAAARMNEDLIAQIEALKRTKIDTLLVDIADNGGGTEWADDAAQMLTPIHLRAGRVGFMRGAHWTKKLGDLEITLRAMAERASPADRKMLLAYADEAAAKKTIAATSCDAAALWEGKHPSCDWLGKGFYDTGVLAYADPATLRGKPWAAAIYSPMEYPYMEGLWRGPLIVLVDSNSASSSERFASVLQNNRAALVMGEPTAGADGGHTDGGTPTTLTHSGAVLIVPDCAALLADGHTQFSGVVPDVLVGFRHPDGPHLRAQSFLTKLPAALAIVKYPLKSVY